MIGAHSGNDRLNIYSSTPPRLRKPWRRWLWLTLAVVVAAIIAVVALRLAAERRAAAEREALTERRDSTLVAHIQQCSRLFTAEAVSRKTVEYESGRSLDVTLGGTKHTLSLPFSTTTATIPVSVKYKAYIDLSHLRRSDIRAEGDTAVTIILPDPVIMQTAVSVDHAAERHHEQWFAKGLTAAEYRALVTRAKDEAWRDLPDSAQRAVCETARVSAAELLLPLTRAAGFRSATVTFRPDYTITRTKR